MKKFFIIFLMLPTACFAETYKITTGAAYIACVNGESAPIVLPVGAEYHTSEGCTLTEVPDEKTLNSMHFNLPPRERT